MDLPKSQFGRLDKLSRKVSDAGDAYMRMSVYDKALLVGIQARWDREAYQKEIDTLIPVAMEECGRF